MDVIIAGAGISGLAAAIALRRTNHRVTIYERSSMNNEIGAAINVPSNASRFLIPWGLDPIKARFVRGKGTHFCDYKTLETLQVVDLVELCEEAGAPQFYAHRVDLHDELKRLACGPEGPGQPIKIVVSSEVETHDPHTPAITLADGTVINGDLVVAADGVHSGAAELILGHPNPPIPADTFNWCYRFLIPTSVVEEDLQTQFFTDHKDMPDICRIWADDDAKCRLISYRCRNLQVLNFVALCYDENELSRMEDWHASIEKAELLDRFKTLHPDLLAVMNKATDIKRWPLLFRAPIPTFHVENMVLIGDAAHPMLPNQAQGGAQGMEDGAALGLVMHGLTDRTQVAARLAVYNAIRHNRATSIQLLSSFGMDQTPHEGVEQYMEGSPIPSMFSKVYDVSNSREYALIRSQETPRDRMAWAVFHDVVKRSEEQMKQFDPSYALPPGFQGTYSLGGL